MIAGGPDESVDQPRWAPDGRLVFLSDRTGWWNLYAATVTDDNDIPVALWPAPTEFAGPHWTLDSASYGISAAGTLVCIRLVDGYARLGIIDLSTGEHTEVDSDLVEVGSIEVGERIAMLVAGYPDLPPSLVRFDADDPTSLEVVRQFSSVTLDPKAVSFAEPVTWTNQAGLEVHGFFYPPVNPDFVAPEGELPPLMVLSHGGPTSMAQPSLSSDIQYWTTRGFAVLQVNYGGSTGYGRAYRERLRGQWGVVDVDDCASGATTLAAAGRVDSRRLAIKGGSAGGYTTLAALAFTDVFTAGASWFGIGDLETLVADTHKFESRYGDSLIGPYPEAAELYRARSPINHVDQIRCPMILLQGADDPVVPRNQAEDMAAAVRAKGLPVALLVFDGEGHGFRRAETLVRALEAEAYFYSRVFGFTLADSVEPIEIDNLPA